MLHRRRFIACGAASCSPFVSASVLAQTALEERISLDDARRLHQAGSAVLIDIREPEEHSAGVAAGARLLPMSQLNQRLREIPVDSKVPVLLICRTQNRSSATLRALRKQLGEQNYAHVRFVQGGMSEWAQRGWPMVSPVKP